MEPTLRSQVYEKSYRKGTPVNLPPTLGTAKHSYGGANVKNRHDEYDRVNNPDISRDGQETCDKRERVPIKPDKSPGESNSAGNDAGRKEHGKNKGEVAKSCKNRAGDPTNDDSSAPDLKTSNSDKRQKSSQRQRRVLSRRADSEEFFSNESESDNEQNRRSSRQYACSSDSEKKPKSSSGSTTSKLERWTTGTAIWPAKVRAMTSACRAKLTGCQKR